MHAGGYNAAACLPIMIIYYLHYQLRGISLTLDTVNPLSTINMITIQIDNIPSFLLIALLMATTKQLVIEALKSGEVQ